MITLIYFAGFVATMTLAGMARYDKNYSEMRTLLATGVLFLCLYMEKIL